MSGVAHAPAAEDYAPWAGTTLLGVGRPPGGRAVYLSVVVTGAGKALLPGGRAPRARFGQNLGDQVGLGGGAGSFRRRQTGPQC